MPTGNDQVSGWADDEPEIADGDDQESSIVLSEEEWGADPKIRVVDDVKSIDNQVVL